MDFSRRADIKELLDEPGIPAQDIYRNMYELAVINSRLGGHSVTWSGFKQLAETNTELHVCEVGCGGGDNMKSIENRAEGRYRPIHFTGIDYNGDCIHIAQQLKWNSRTEFVTSDYKQVTFPHKPDIIFSSLFCHHFKEAELVGMFRWMYSNSRLGFFINDLHRHSMAYRSIRVLTKLFSRSYLVKNDAPLSVLRGFKKIELQQLLKQAGITHYTLRWKWAFRWLIVAKHEQ